MSSQTGFFVGTALAWGGMSLAESRGSKWREPTGLVLAVFGTVYAFTSGLQWLKGEAAASVSTQGVYALGKCPCAAGQPLSKCRGAL